MTEEIDDKIHERIKQLCNIGDQFCDSGNYKEAIKKYRNAWKLIPEPQTDWHASTWVLTAIGDAYIFNGDYDYAKETLEYAMHCPEALGNSYIHLRLGQVYFELNEEKMSADQLTRAYMGGGKEIFDGQPDKYFDFLKTKIKL